MKMSYAVFHLNRLKKSLDMLETTDVATLMGCASTRINRLTEENKHFRNALEELAKSNSSKCAKNYAKVVLETVDKVLYGKFK